MRVAAAVVGCDPLGSEVGDDVELVFAQHLHDRDVLLAERSRLCLPPRRLVAESCLRGVLDLGCVDAVVLVRHVDGERARSVGGLGERDCELAMAETDHLDQGVVAPKGDAAADDQLRVAPELVRLHRSCPHPGRR